MLNWRRSPGGSPKKLVHGSYGGRGQSKKNASAILGVGSANDESQSFELPHPSHARRSGDRGNVSHVSDGCAFVGELDCIEFKKNVPGRIGKDSGVSECLLASPPRGDDATDPISGDFSGRGARVEVGYQGA